MEKNPPKPGEGAAQGTAHKSLQAFASEEALNVWLKTKKDLYEEDVRLRYPQSNDDSMPSPPPSPPPINVPVDKAWQGESVANNRTASVDEAGIVKVHKNHLVILRGGRLFTVHIGDDALRPVDMQDAFAPGSRRDDPWELLISGNTVVVISYSHDKGGSEIGLFGIGDDGRLTYRATYILRANDFLPSIKYTSRLIGNTLILYTPLYLDFDSNLEDCLPAVYRWREGETADFRRIAPATRIYRTADDLDPTERESIALHTVTTCEIAEDRLECSAMAVLAYGGHEVYVARDAIYVWNTPFRYWNAGNDTNRKPVFPSVFRLPLNMQEAPTALKTHGSPIDHLSFLESADGYLNVLLRAEGPARSMWASEQGRPNLALLRTPLRDFGDGSTSAPPEHYHLLPVPGNGIYLQNRYIGDHLVYGAGESWWQGVTAPYPAYLLKWNDPDRVEAIAMPHDIDRIEALGNTPLLVGRRGNDLYFSTLDLQPAAASPHQSQEREAPMARIADTFKLKDAAQAKPHSHGFFYRANTEHDTSGLLGLPYVSADHQDWNPKGIIFLRNDHLRLSKAGALTASSHAQYNDQCCMDWYGSSRPLFVAKRIFALMGYEIVEGKMVNGRLKETRRIDFSRQQKVRK